MTDHSWLTVKQGHAPLLVSFPHTGLNIPPECEAGLVSPALARHDADWHIDHLYAFAADLGATTVHTGLSRTVIDVNRDPSGESLYPGQATTGLVPTETFDGRPLYRDGAAPTPERSSGARQTISSLIMLRSRPNSSVCVPLTIVVVLYDCHSIRSVIPRLFPGELPVFNIGTNDGRSCDPALAGNVAAICAASRWPHILNGRFKGGWITRTYGKPDRRRPRGADGARAARLSSRRERSAALGPRNLPNPMQGTLRAVLETCLAFARR